jgi:hypothetical protein
MARIQKICIPDVESAKSGLEIVVRTLPHHKEDLRLPLRSLKTPEKTLAKKASEIATPSISPSLLWERPSSSVINAGKTEKIIKEEQDQKKLITKTTTRGRRFVGLLRWLREEVREVVVICPFFTGGFTPDTG